MEGRGGLASGLPADHAGGSKAGRAEGGQHPAKGHNVFGNTHRSCSLRTRFPRPKVSPEAQELPKNRPRVRSRKGEGVSGPDVWPQALGLGCSGRLSLIRNGGINTLLNKF